MELSKKVWKATSVSYSPLTTNHFPTEERFGLAAHIRKTMLSVPSNIAEGCGRNSEKEFFHFLNIAQGSASELDCQFELAHELTYMIDTEYDELRKGIEEVQRMLRSLMELSKKRIQSLTTKD